MKMSTKITKNITYIEVRTIYIVTGIYLANLCFISTFQVFSSVWNKNESRFKKDFGHSQNLS
jgi:hypothetical protein